MVKSLSLYMRACLLSLNNLRRRKKPRSYKIRSYRKKKILKFKITIQFPGNPSGYCPGGSVVSSSLSGCVFLLKIKLPNSTLCGIWQWIKSRPCRDVSIKELISTVSLDIYIDLGFVVFLFEINISATQYRFSFLKRCFLNPLQVWPFLNYGLTFLALIYGKKKNKSGLRSWSWIWVSSSFLTSIFDSTWMWSPVFAVNSVFPPVHEGMCDVHFPFWPLEGIRL